MSAQLLLLIGVKNRIQTCNGDIAVHRWTRRLKEAIHLLRIALIEGDWGEWARSPWRY